MSDPVLYAQALTRIPSVNPYYDPKSIGESNVCEWMRKWGVENGFDTRTHEVFPGRSNLVMQLKNGAGKHLLLNGHMDTVGVQGMTIDPFGGEIKGDRLWGRGSCDMKGPNSCFMATALALKDDLKTWRGTLTLGFVVDEEYRFSGIKKLMENIDKPDFAVVGEPTSMKVVRGSKGVLRFTLAAKGRACHSSDPAKGRSAIVAISEAVLALQDYFTNELSKITRPEFGCSTGSIGVIEGGSGVNIVPERCAVQVDIRLVPGQKPLDTYSGMQACVKEKCRRVPDIEWSFSDPTVIEVAYDTPADAELIKTACRVLDCPTPEVVLYSCDASTIAAAGVPTAVIGPGQIEQAHTAQESVSVGELRGAVGLYTRLARELLR